MTTTTSMNVMKNVLDDPNLPAFPEITFGDDDNPDPMSAANAFEDQEEEDEEEEEPYSFLVEPNNDITIKVPRYAPKSLPRSGEPSYPSKLHYIHVQSILSDEEAAKCLQLAREYASKTGCWDAPDWGRHKTYATCDFPVEEDLDGLSPYLDSICFRERIFGRLYEAYGVPPKDLEYEDIFCSNYQARTDGEDEDEDDERMDRLEAHRDGSVLSFTLTLSPPDEFEGGGTFFDALRDRKPGKKGVLLEGGVVRPTRAGDAVLHSGKILHGGSVITKGSRTVLTGFVRVNELWVEDGVMAEACKEFGRMDVALYSYVNLLRDTNNATIPFLATCNGPYLPKPPKKSYLGTGVLPITSLERTMRARAEPVYQRDTKLVAEDVMLRSLLCEEKSKDPKKLMSNLKDWVPEEDFDLSNFKPI